jgi:predicted transcriptional regulator
MGKGNCRALVGLLSRRGHILNRIAEGTRDRCKLVEEVDESRSTVYRSLNELAEAGLLEETAGNYDLTLYGQLVYEKFKLFDESISNISAARDVLTTFSGPDNFDSDVLAGADVIEPTRQEPDRPIRTIERTIRGADSVKCIAPTTLLLNAASDYTTDESTAELLVEASALQHFEETNSEKLDCVRDDSRFTLRARQTEFPFGLVLVEDDAPKMMVVVYTEEWDLEGLIRNDSEVAVSWTRDAYRNRLPRDRLA